MDTGIPDFTLAEQTFARRLREQGLFGTSVERGVTTGIEGLELYRSECKVLQLPSDDQNAERYYATLEVRAPLEHSWKGSAEVLDLITLPGESAEEAIVCCAETFMDVTFPALRAIFHGPDAVGATHLEVTSYTPALGKPLAWNLFTGRLQVLNDEQGWLAKTLQENSPLVLVFNTLTGYLANPTMHWCKVWGTSLRSSELVFGCSIDGTKSFEAEEEILSKFPNGDEVHGRWEFRQFFIMYPTGVVDDPSADDLKMKAAELLPKKKRRWPWSRQ